MMIQEHALWVAPAWLSAWAIPIGAGICLSAATGFRTFVPLLCVALAARFGVFNLDAQYGWLISTAAVIALATAALFEVGAYYIPVVDNLLDVIATPLSMVAGTLVMFTSIGADHGLPGWLLATVVGGGLSGMVQLTTAKARAISPRRVRRSRKRRRRRSPRARARWAPIRAP